MLEIHTETVVWLINSNSNLTAQRDAETTTTTAATTTTTTSWLGDDGTEIDGEVETIDREPDKMSSATLIAPNDSEIVRTKITARSTTTAFSTTMTTTSTTISTTTAQKFLSEQSKSNEDENLDENEANSDSDDEEEESEDEGDEEISESFTSKHSNKVKCPSIPPNLVGRLKVNLTSPSWKELETTPGFTRLGPGGEFSPEDCDPEFSG